MELTDPVKRILSYYESDNPGTKANLARVLLQGRLGGTGKLLILPVNQGVEHGPARSFAPNPPALTRTTITSWRLTRAFRPTRPRSAFSKPAPTPSPAGFRRSSSSTTPTT